MADVGFRQVSALFSLQVGIGGNGAFIDIDIGNPLNPIGAIIHAFEVLNPGSTSPFAVSRALGSRVTGHDCK